jgi:tetratricopeptide (TPR) repeat protein
LEEVRSLTPDREEIYLSLAYFYEEDNKTAQAIAVLTEGLEKVPRPVELHFRLAVLYEKTKNRDESIVQIKKVLELDPKNPDAQNFLGYTYADMGIHLDEAEKLIRAALLAKPDSGHIIDSLGWLFFRKGYVGKAVVELERAFRIMPQDGTVAEHLGDAYFKQRRYNDALRLYRQALGLENNNPPELRKKIQQIEKILQGPNL